MNKFAFVALAFVFSAVGAPTFLDKFAKRNTEQKPTPKQEMVFVEKSKPRSENVSYASGRIAKIEADSRGHFVTDAWLNGNRAEVLIDTGATHVAINASTARRLGIQLRNKDFKYKVMTANGRTKVALTKIDKIEIGRITVEDVSATVSKDDHLETILLGMSFMNKLDKFSMEDNMLYMKE